MMYTQPVDGEDCFAWDSFKMFYTNEEGTCNTTNEWGFWDETSIKSIGAGFE